MILQKYSHRFSWPAVLLLMACLGPANLWAQAAKSSEDWAARAELAFWDSVKDSKDPKEFKAYLSAYPKGYFASLAKLRIEALSESTELTQQPGVSVSPVPANTEVESKPQKPVETQAGNGFRDCDSCPQMVVIPAGRFQMGSRQGEVDEQPLHAVTIGSPFAMGIYDVTVGEWGACVRDGACARVTTTDQEVKLPVTNVSWTDTQEYLKWLKDKTGNSYRLPSEAEWEYAARGGTTTTYWWGNDKGKNRANCTDCGSRWDRKGASPVGSFEPNPFGLYDVHGNAWEWVQDCWNPSYQGAPSDGSPWTQGDCLSRVLRGGAWRLDHDYMRAARRSRYDRDVRYDQNGFRVVKELPPQGPPPLAQAVQEAVRSAFATASRGASGNNPQAFVIDPLIDGLSALETAETRSMESSISKQIQSDYKFFRKKDFAELGSAGVTHVLIGTFTGVNKEHKTAGVRDEFRVCLAMLDLGTNKVTGKAKVFSQAAGVDLTPTAFFRDSPAWMADPASQAYINTCQALPLGDPIDPAYLDRLKAASVISQAIQAYDGGRYDEAKQLFERASQMKGGKQLRTYNGLYLTNSRLGQHEEAAEAFGRIVDYGLEKRGFAVKFPFRPDSTDLVADAKTGSDPELWLEQIAQATLRRGDCLEIVGNTGRTGSEGLDGRLSIRRAELIKRQLETDAPALSTRMIATGKGSQENLVGSGTGDTKDALDSRIEFQSVECTTTG